MISSVQIEYDASLGYIDLAAIRDEDDLKLVISARLARQPLWVRETLVNMMFEQAIDPSSGSLAKVIDLGEARRSATRTGERRTHPRPAPKKIIGH